MGTVRFLCSKHGFQDTPCCITIEIGEPKVPEENVTEHVKCSHVGCKSIFWRPQEADGALQTVDIAQTHGWTVVDREKGLVHCAWGHGD